KDNQSWLTSGVHIVNDSQLIFEAMDQNRFLSIKLNPVSNSEKFDIIVSGSIFQVLKSIKDDIKISVLQNLIQFDTKNLILVTNSLTGKFPDFNKVIDFETNTHIKIDDTTRLIEILNNVKVFSEEVQIDFGNNEIS